MEKSEKDLRIDECQQTDKQKFLEKAAEQIKESIIAKESNELIRKDLLNEELLKIDELQAGLIQDEKQIRQSIDLHRMQHSLDAESGNSQVSKKSIQTKKGLIKIDKLTEEDRKMDYSTYDNLVLNLHSKKKFSAIDVAGDIIVKKNTYMDSSIAFPIDKRISRAAAKSDLLKKPINVFNESNHNYNNSEAMLENGRGPANRMYRTFLVNRGGSLYKKAGSFLNDKEVFKTIEDEDLKPDENSLLKKLADTLNFRIIAAKKDAKFQTSQFFDKFNLNPKNIDNRRFVEKQRQNLLNTNNVEMNKSGSFTNRTTITRTTSTPSSYKNNSFNIKFNPDIKYRITNYKKNFNYGVTQRNNNNKQSIFDDIKKRVMATSRNDPDNPKFFKKM